MSESPKYDDFNNRYPGDFRIKDITLYNYGGQTVDITGVTSIINIYQDLDSAFISGNIMFFDTKDFLDDEIKQISKNLNLNPKLIHQVPLELVLSESDVLSIHVPLIKETRDMISTKELNGLNSSKELIALIEKRLSLY